MKKNNSVFKTLAAVCFLLIIASCSSIKGTGPLVTEGRKLSEITSLDLEMNADVYLIKGDTQNVVIRAQQNIMNVLKTDVSDGKLEIKTSEPISVTEPIQIWVTLKNIEEIELNGSGSIVSTTEFNTEEITADVSGSGKISLVLSCEKFESEVSGSGDIYLKGKIAKGKFEITGSGNIYATECNVDKCKVAIEGSGTAKINVASELDASIDGSGEVLYSGNPQKVKSDINGSGHISKME